MKDEEKRGTVRNAEVFSVDYLLAKKDIDDAALNAHVLESLTRVLRTGSPKMPRQVGNVAPASGQCWPVWWSGRCSLARSSTG